MTGLHTEQYVHEINRGLVLVVQKCSMEGVPSAVVKPLPNRSLPHPRAPPMEHEGATFRCMGYTYETAVHC